MTLALHENEHRDRDLYDTKGVKQALLADASATTGADTTAAATVPKKAKILLTGQRTGDFACVAKMLKRGGNNMEVEVITKALSDKVGQ